MPSNPTPFPPPVGAEDDEGPDERLYDAYLDAALAGRIESPDAFLARNPAAGAQLRARLEALHGMLGDDPGKGHSVEGVAATDGVCGAAEEGMPYERLGEFRLLRRIAEGGMGTVYLAEQESLGRVVALKVIRPELLGSPTAAARFEREAQVIARLRHPNIVTAFAVGADRGVRYLALEFVPGRGLDEILAEAATAKRRLEPVQAVTWAAQIARALECAHAAGIVHRDVKPGNIRIAPDGRALLLDFGIAHDTEALGLTRTGPLLGSPAYAAPEQVGATGRVGPYTDVHGLGATLYECLSGRAPHLGTTIEETLHRVLETQATPVRRLNAAVSRDLETVLTHALEKDPAHRYPTAAALADDLDALLAFRPIAARRPGSIRRSLHWLRRHPAVATGSLVALLALGGTGVLTVMRERAAVQRRRDDARDAVAQARDSIARYRLRRAQTEDLEKRVTLLLEKQQTKYLTDEQDRFLAREEDAADLARREREQAFYDVLELLRRAERLDPDRGDVRRVRAELYAEKWREMRVAGASGAARLYRDLVARDDPTGAMLAAVEGGGRIVLESEPSGAEVHLFRYRELADVLAGGEHRLVPCPTGEGAATPLVPPGTWACVVIEDADGLRAGDLILELDGSRVEALQPGEARDAVLRGGALATVLTNDALIQRRLPEGLVARATTQPLALDPSSSRGRTPLELDLLTGEYVAVFTAPGREPTRSLFRVHAGRDETRQIALLPVGSTPRGFVRVLRQIHDVPYPFWIMEREVTTAEYLEYLNDPETLAALDAGTPPERVPRSRPGEPLWTRDDSGRFVLPVDWPPTLPVIAISQRDALAYAAYRNARRDDAHDDHVFDLPNLQEWTIAAGAGESDLRLYVFGRRFRPKWVSSCYARPTAGPVAVMSHPRDESSTGAFDMCGSAIEWSVDPYHGGRDLVRLLGGAWGRADPEMFKVQGGLGLDPASTSGETGMRLVLRPRDAR